MLFHWRHIWEFTPIYLYYLCYLYLFKYTSVQQDFHIMWCFCRLTVIRRVGIVEPDLPYPSEVYEVTPQYVSCSAHSLIFCLVFVDHFFLLLGNVVLFVLRFYSFWLPIGYLQTFLIFIQARILRNG